jgi:hypothetical protein
MVRGSMALVALLITFSGRLRDMASSTLLNTDVVEKMVRERKRVRVKKDLPVIGNLV